MVAPQLVEAQTGNEFVMLPTLLAAFQKPSQTHSHCPALRGLMTWFPYGVAWKSFSKYQGVQDGYQPPIG